MATSSRSAAIKLLLHQLSSPTIRVASNLAAKDHHAIFNYGGSTDCRHSVGATTEHSSNHYQRFISPLNLPTLYLSLNWIKRHHPRTMICSTRTAYSQFRTGMRNNTNPESMSQFLPGDQSLDTLVMMYLIANDLDIRPHK
jgi:hypothetical protein